MKKKSFEKSLFQCDIEKVFRITSQLAQNVYTFLKTSRAGLSEVKIEFCKWAPLSLPERRQLSSFREDFNKIYTLA